ncbi:mediator of DNA damage checkpoint protein 1 isoform X2 [Syngnathus typhle]|uniref:mediator of DNA damage checkpoint protein 1 isoform X2 n=1 Tax=Syngnathus typhle TaxID=161592 RepID=UPI002A6A4965|nr:mediator of DNA damage checkpoint protein 1 isoform X2 [Syngnathus typhle]
MDATQAVNDSFESDEEENKEKADNGQQPLAKLCILKNDHLPEREFPLFMGDNVLGRDGSACTLPLPAPSVSKRHASIRITVHQRPGSRSGVNVEAVVRDLGSMNGTRIGRVKLIPNISYPLSEGNSLVVADMPCQYLGISEVRQDVGGCPVSLQGESVEKRDSCEESASWASRASAKVSPPSQVKKKPTQKSYLFLETPVQLRGTLVPESESDSDGERPGNREARRKLQGSDSMATCSTFLSPTNQIVPESPHCEDGTPITLSSSPKDKPHVRVAFGKAEPGTDATGQRKKDTLASEYHSDGEGQAGGVTAREQLKSKTGFTEDDLAQVSTSAVLKLNMDTEVEDVGQVDAACFHMDSDTDVDEDDTGAAGAPPTRPEGSGACPHVSPLDKKDHAAPPSLPDDFQLDSDTDVDEKADDRDTGPSGPDAMGPACQSDDEPALALNAQSNVTDSAARLNNGHAERATPHSSAVLSAPSSDVARSESDADKSSASPTDWDTDTDAEEEKNAQSLSGIKATALRSPHLQNCSTPVQLSEGQVKEMETQAFLKPSLEPFERGFYGTVRSAAVPLCFDSQEEEEDFAVAKTQSFVLRPRRPTPSRDVDALSGKDTNELPSGGASFQLDLSDGGYQQSAPQARACVSDTQANSSSADGIAWSMEATQAYEAPQVNVALQETQAYASEPDSKYEEEPEQDAETQTFDSFSLALAETQLAAAFHEKDLSTTNTPVAPINPNRMAKTTNVSQCHYVAVTIAGSQPRCTREAVQSVPVVGKTNSKQPQLEEATQAFTATVMVEKQPRAASHTEDEPILDEAIWSARRLAADCQPLGIAATQPMATRASDGEDASPLLGAGKVQESDGTNWQHRKVQLDSLCVATQPLTQNAHLDSDDEDFTPAFHGSKLQLDQVRQACIISYTLAANHPFTSVALTQPTALCVTDVEDSIKEEPQPNANRSVGTPPASVAATQQMAASEHEKECSIRVFRDTDPGKNRADGQEGGNELSSGTYMQAEEKQTRPNLEEDKSGCGQDKKETQMLMNSKVPSAGTQPVYTCEDEQANGMILSPGTGIVRIREKDEPREKRQTRSYKAKGTVAESRPAASELEEGATGHHSELREVQDRKQERQEGRNAQRERKERKETNLSKTVEDQERHEEHKPDQAPQPNLEAKAEPTARARRATRRTIPVLPPENVPAKRTRLRSNSVSSEVSASSGRGNRGQMPKTSNGTEQDGHGTSPLGAFSRSSSSNSLASDMSCDSLGSLSGTGGGQRGSRRRTKPRPSTVPPVFRQNPAPRPSQRGKKPNVFLAALCDEKDEKPKSKQATATTERRRANEPSSREGNNSAGESPLPKRNIRGKVHKTVKSKAFEAVETPLGSDQVEAKDQAGGAKRMLKAEVQDENPVSVQAKRRAKAPSAQRDSKAKKSPPDAACQDGNVSSSGGGVQTRRPIGSKRQTPDARMKSSPVTARCRPPEVSRTYKVLFTGVVDLTGEKMLARLGGFLANGTADMNCLVTDKVRRTVKFMCAAARGIPIVNICWLDESAKAGSFLPPDAFIVSDPDQEKKFNFRLRESLRLAGSQPLLQGYKIHVTKSVQPEPAQMSEIISCSGATFLPRMPSSHKPHTVVISCTEDWPLCRAAVLASLPIVSAEFVLSGILQHKLDFDAHKMSDPPPWPNDGRRRSSRLT